MLACSIKSWDGPNCTIAAKSKQEDFETTKDMDEKVEVKWNIIRFQEAGSSKNEKESRTVGYMDLTMKAGFK